MAIHSLYARSIVVGISILFLSIPSTIYAATLAPECSLVVVTLETVTMLPDEADEEIFVAQGKRVGLLWIGENADTATNAQENTIPLIGIEIVLPEESDTYTYTFEKDGKKTSCSVSIHPVLGNVSKESLIPTASKPTITGTVSGTESVYVQLRDSETERIIYTSKKITAVNGNWKTTVSKKLTDGTYVVELVGERHIYLNTIAKGTLVVGEPTISSADTTLAVQLIPLLSGGTVRAGSTVPISYLQIQNTGKESAILSGFWVQQKGSASTDTIQGLTSIDDRSLLRGSVGGNEGDMPFKNGKAFIPMNAEFLPDQTRLFTLKAIFANSIASYSKTDVTIDVVSIESNASSRGAFPIQGTTWSITQ